MDGRKQRQLFSSATNVVRESNKTLAEQIDNTVSSESNIVRSIMEGKKKPKKKEVLDPVGKEDKDIDNDGDSDKTDSYLLNRRKKRTNEIEKAKSGKPKKLKKTLNERKAEILDSLLDEASSDPAARLGRAFDRAKQERAAGKEYVKQLFAKAHEEDAGPTVEPESPEQKADWAAHEAGRVEKMRHSYDPAERREQRRAETPQQDYLGKSKTVSTFHSWEHPAVQAMGHPADTEATAQEMDHARLHSAIEDAGGIHAGDHEEHGITSFDLGAGEGQAHKGWMHTSDQERHQGKIFVPHEVSLGDSTTHAFFQQGKESIGRRLNRHEEGDLNNLYNIKSDSGIKSESVNKKYTQKDLTEATMNRIKSINKTKKSYDTHPGMDRLR